MNEERWVTVALIVFGIVFALPVLAILAMGVWWTAIQVFVKTVLS